MPLEEYFMIPVKEGGVRFLALTNDDLQLIVGLTGGLLLIYHVSDIIKSVGINYESCVLHMY